MDSKINIFVACHKPTYVLKNPLLIPVQVGSALTEQRYEGMRCDNEGLNISLKNQRYCELTAQFWAWKNVESDYYGFFHYRRYLSFAYVYPVGNNGKLIAKRRVYPYIEVNDIREELSPYRLEEEWMRQQIMGYDLLTVLRERINTTVYRQYCQYHPKWTLDLLLAILERKYPEYTFAAKQYMNSKEIYYMNMYIMRKAVFQMYMSWLFDILYEFERHVDLDHNQTWGSRLMGYLAERLFGVFYTYHRGKGMVCAELSYLKIYNTDINKMVTEQSNIRIFQLKPTKHKIKIDMRKLNRMFPAGTKRRMLIRNLFLR